MQQQQQQEMLKNLTNQQVVQYNKMRQDYAEIFRIYLDIEDEKKEHTLVLDAVKNVDPKRRCWRLIGGVLVERQLEDVLKSLKESLELLEKTGQNLQHCYETERKRIT
ncbi:unnamed protein product (macronuclear) [Paramecium tetraurelia]|uniref:Prefoldin subunit 2 n=1 Tax=Paramecium tetraurelia TaxID=5888 RepID=A0DEI0_PARTE|nr:uncharacterized protein GSPATT00016273001 [Paramecium tetraurelia]CAK81447.1 unnamed protein product [Paramecium tetraurelia]|eukprot:XP_001448844.1 hypothetical protein (macronuclear) [Paramecium tetraurelia strain d4-2]